MGCFCCFCCSRNCCYCGLGKTNLREGSLIVATFFVAFGLFMVGHSILSFNIELPEPLVGVFHWAGEFLAFVLAVAVLQILLHVMLILGAIWNKAAWLAIWVVCSPLVLAFFVVLMWLGIVYGFLAAHVNKVFVAIAAVYMILAAVVSGDYCY